MALGRHPPSGRLKPWPGVAFATLVTALTLWFRLSIDGPLGGRPTLVIFAMPIMLSAYMGGLWPGLLSTALSYLGASYYLLPPIYSFEVSSGVERFQQFFVVLAGVVITVLNEALHRARGRADLLTDEHQRASMALHESQEIFSVAFRSSPLALAITTEDGLYVETNQAFCDLLGYSREEVIGRPVIESGMVSRSEREALVGGIDRAGGSANNVELQIRTRDGTPRDIIYSIAPITLRGTRHRLSTGLDITGRKRAEAALREAHQTLEQRVLERTAALEGANAALFQSRAELNSLFESLPGLYLVLTPDLTIIAASDAYLKATMTTREGILGHGLFEIFPDNPEDPDAQGTSHLRASLDRVIENAAPDTMAIQKYDVRRPDGTFEERYWSPINSPVLGADRRIQYIVHRVEEVTDFVRQKNQAAESPTTLSAREQQMEAEVFRRSQELQATNQKLAAANRDLEAFSTAVSRDLRVAEAADQLKSAFLATMSHELRTPLNSIIGFTGIVLQGLAGPLNPEQAKQLGTVMGSAKHLLELINDVLDLSKIEAGELEVHAEPFDLKASIERVLTMIRPLAQKKGLTLTAAVSPTVDEMVSDRRRVEQILINLLSNAVKFTNTGGVSLTIDRDAEVVRLTVTDTGIGIEVKDLAILFQPFQQIDSGLARQTEGTGLGLAISRRLTGLLGGTISVESEAAKGATFTVTLPLEFRATDNPKVVAAKAARA